MHGARNFVDQLFDLGHLGGALVKAKMIASLEINGGRAVGILLQVDLQYLLRHVVVVEFVVAERNVNVEREVVSENMAR